MVNPFVLRVDSEDTSAEVTALTAPGAAFAALAANGHRCGVRFSPILQQRGEPNKRRVEGHSIRLAFDLIDQACPYLIVLLGADYGQYCRDPDEDDVPIELAEGWEVRLATCPRLAEQTVQVAAQHNHSWVARGRHAKCSLLELCAVHAVSRLQWGVEC